MIRHPAFILLLQICLVSGRNETCSKDIEDFFYNVSFAGPIFDQPVYIINSNFSVDCEIGTDVFSFTVRRRTDEDRPSYISTNYTARNLNSDNSNITVRSNDSSFDVVKSPNVSDTYVLQTKTCPLNYFRPFHRHLFSLLAQQFYANRSSAVSTALVQIDLMNANAHAPVFVDDTQIFYLSETAELGTPFGTVYATDADNDTITYSTDSAQFAIDPSTGVLRLEEKLQYLHLTNPVRLNITIKDSCCSSSTPPCVERRNWKIFLVFILAVNKNAPRFAGDICERTISFKENVTPGETIATWQVSDTDRGENGQIDISFPFERLRTTASGLRNTAYSLFYIEQEDQVNSTRRASLKTNHTFDYDQPGMHIVSDCSRMCGHTIMVREKNDLCCTGATRMWSLSVLATDSGKPARQAFCSLHINLLDVNDNRPKFVMTAWSYTIYNTTSLDQNRRLLRVVASDADSGSNGMVSYYIGTLNVPYFIMNRTTGYVTLRDGISQANLNVSYFPLTFDVYAEDRGTPRLLSENNATVTIDYSNSANAASPKWLYPPDEELNISIREKLYENSTDRIVRDLTANFNGTIAYQLPGNMSSIMTVYNPCADNAQSPFRGTQVTKDGLIFKSSIAITSGLHAEIQDVYLLYLRVLVNPPLIQTVTIHVLDENDQSPTFDLQSLSLTVMEKDEGIRTIARVRAFDRDVLPENNEVRYQLNEHLSDDKANETFFVESNGTICTRAVFGREPWTKKSYRLFITAYNEKLAWDEKTNYTEDFQIDVQVIGSNQNSPEFVEVGSVRNITINETKANGSVIGTLNIIHQDIDTSLNVGILSGNVQNAFTFTLSSNNFDNITRTRYEAVGILKVVAPLDYISLSLYTLELFASDGRNITRANVTIHLQQQNTKAPYFKLMPGFRAYQYTVQEEGAGLVDGSPIIAIDPDDPQAPLVYKIYDSNHQLNLQSVSLQPEGNGQRINISLPGLSRDRPFGSPVYNFTIQATDKNGSGVSSYAPVSITVTDINNKAPIPINFPWYIDEGTNVQMRIEFDDYDDLQQNNTIPFTVTVVQPANVQIAPTQGSNPNFTLTYFGVLNFTTTKHFNVTLTATDARNRSATTTITIRVRGRQNNDCPLSDARKRIRIVYVDGYQNSIRNIGLGSIHVASGDNCITDQWVYSVGGDNNSKIFSAAGGLLNTTDVLDPGLLTVDVTVRKPNSASALSKITLETENVQIEDVRQAATIRIRGEYPHTLIDLALGNTLDRLRNALASLLNIPNYSIKILTIRSVFQYRSPLLPPKPLEVEQAEALTDVVFYAFKLDKVTVEKALHQRLDQFRSRFQIQADASGPNPCSGYVCPPDTVCRPSRTIGPKATVVDTAQMAFVGVNIRDSADCVNSLNDPASLNGSGSRPLTTFDSLNISSTSSSDGPLGPNGEVLGRTFYDGGEGYAVFRGAAFPNFAPSRLSFDFIVQSPVADGLILLHGRNTSEGEDFLWIALEILQSNLKFHFRNLTQVAMGFNLTASKWHHIEYQFRGSEVLFSVNDCQYKRAIDTTNNPRDLSTVLLYLGRLPSQWLVSAAYPSLQSISGFRGCIRNVLSNGYYLDMSEHLVEAHSTAGECICSVSDSCDNRRVAVPWYTWLIIALVLLFLITVLTLVVLTLLRKKYQMKALGVLYMDDTRDNIIDYKEAAGEQDHATYNLHVLKKPAYTFTDGTGIAVDGRLNSIDWTSAGRPSLRDYIEEKLNEQSLRPAYDTQLRFRDEGADLSTADLSSIESSTLPEEINYAFLSSLGPKFARLAAVYADHTEQYEDS